MSHLQYMPGDPRLVDQIVYELKSKGIFDKFRKECIADVDTRPAYQNLRQRVESSVSMFLGRQKWNSDLNKNQLREKLRKHILDGNYLEQGVERIVDQVVNPKVASVFIPQVEEIVCNYLGIPRKKTVPETSNGTKEDLLPTDLEAVSPESVHSHDEKEENMETNENGHDDKMDIDTKSEPKLEESVSEVVIEKADNQDSQISGIIDLTSRDSEVSMDVSAIPFPTEGIKLENIPRPEKEVEVEKIALPKDPYPDIPLPDEIPLPKSENNFKPLGLNSESDDDDSSSDSSIIRNMSPLTPVRNFDDDSCDAQQGFENVAVKEEDKNGGVSSFRFAIESKGDTGTDIKDEKLLSYKFDNQMNLKFDTPHMEDSSNSNNLQIDYESDANSKAVDIKVEPDNNSEDIKKEKTEEKKSSHKSSSHHSRDSHRSSSSKDKKSDSRHSSSKDSESKSKKSTESKDDHSKSKSKKDTDRKDSSRDSSKHRHSSHKTSSSSSSRDKDSKSHRSSSSSHRHSSSKSDDKKSSSSSSKDKSQSHSDKKDSKPKESSRSSHRSDKDKGKSSSSKEDKKKDKKHTDDHYSASGRNNHTRRSTDRDSNDGNSTSSKGSNNQSGAKATESKSTKESNSKSENTSSSSSGASPSDKERAVDVNQANRVIRIETHLETPIAQSPIVPTPEVILKKPKIAANFEEAKKLMKMRKFLNEEQKRMNQEAALLLEFHASVQPNLSQVYSNISGPELEFACIGSTNETVVREETVETNEMIEDFVNNTTNESEKLNVSESTPFYDTEAMLTSDATNYRDIEITIESEDSSESNNKIINSDEIIDHNSDQETDAFAYFTKQEIDETELCKNKHIKMLQNCIRESNKLYLVNCDKYVENVFKELDSLRDIVCYERNGHIYPRTSNIRNVKVENAEVSIPFDYNSPPQLFSPVKSECSFELSSDYDTKLEERLNNTSRQQIMEIILGGVIGASPSKMPTIDICTESSIEVAESQMKRRYSDIELDNNNRQVLTTPNKIRKLSESDQISSTTEEPVINQILGENPPRSKFLGKARRVGLPKPKRMNVSNSPSSDKSVENYEQNTDSSSTINNCRVKATTPRNKIQRYDTSDLYKPKLHYLSRRNIS